MKSQNKIRLFDKSINEPRNYYLPDIPEIIVVEKRDWTWKGKVEPVEDTAGEDQQLEQVDLGLDSGEPAPGLDAGKPWDLALESLDRNAQTGFYGVAAERMLYDPDILPLLDMCLRSFRSLLRAALYIIDKVIVEPLSSKLRRGEAEVYLLLDAGQCSNPSCTSQRRAMIDLKDWGAHIRIRRPGPGMTSAQHEKTWLFDRQLLFVGSANATGNSFHRCEEAVVVTKSATLIGQQEEHFDMLWSTSKEVDWDALEAKDLEAQDKRGKRATSPSRGR